MRHFIVTDLSSTSMSLPPMAKKARIAVHLLAEVYGLKSRSMGSGKNRFPVLERTSKTTVVGVSERRVRAIVGTADGEHELDGMDGDWGGPRGKGKYRGKAGGLWKALESATGKKSGGSGGRRDQLGKNSEGAVVGQGVRPRPAFLPLSCSSSACSADSRLSFLSCRRTRLARTTSALRSSRRWGASRSPSSPSPSSERELTSFLRSWTVGGQIGLSGQGLHEPVVARVKTVRPLSRSRCAPAPRRLGRAPSNLVIRLGEAEAWPGCPRLDALTDDALTLLGVARAQGKSGLGLGGGFAVSRDEAWALARGPE